MTSVPGVPVNMKCHEALIYVAAGSSVVAIDLRTMQKVFTAGTHQAKLYSFEAFPSKSLICTGGDGRAMLRDIRRNQETVIKPEPIAELDGHTGPVTFLHIDPYKIVTAGQEDVCVNVWEADTGTQTNSFTCGFPEEPSVAYGCSAMAVELSPVAMAPEWDFYVIGTSLMLCGPLLNTGLVMVIFQSFGIGSLIVIQTKMKK